MERRSSRVVGWPTGDQRGVRGPQVQGAPCCQPLQGRGNFLSEGMPANSFTSHQRDATGRIMLSHLSRAEGFCVVTLAISRRSKSVAYRDFLRWLDNWAAQEDETAMVFYDGHQGYSPDLLNVSQEEAGREWETALREATPYRIAHRGLEISTRRIVEDVVMQDSRYSQLIQAADLIAYGAFHKHAQDHPEVWGKNQKSGGRRPALFPERSAPI